LIITLSAIKIAGRNKGAFNQYLAKLHNYYKCICW